MEVGQDKLFQDPQLRLHNNQQMKQTGRADEFDMAEDNPGWADIPRIDTIVAAYDGNELVFIRAYHEWQQDLARKDYERMRERGFSVNMADPGLLSIKFHLTPLSNTK